MEKVLELWTTFAKTGNPNNKTNGSKIENITWTKYEKQNSSYFDIGKFEQVPFDKARFYSMFTRS